MGGGAFSNLQQALRKAKTKDRAEWPLRSTASSLGYAVPTGPKRVDEPRNRTGNGQEPLKIDVI